MKLDYIEIVDNAYDIRWKGDISVDQFIKSILESDRKERGSIFDADTYATIATFNCTKDTPLIRTYDELYSKFTIIGCTAEKKGDAMYYMAILNKKGK